MVLRKNEERQVFLRISFMSEGQREIIRVNDRTGVYIQQPPIQPPNSLLSCSRVFNFTDPTLCTTGVVPGAHQNCIQLLA